MTDKIDNNQLREAIEQAHMAGQSDADIDPSYSNARAYFDTEFAPPHNESLELLKKCLRDTSKERLLELWEEAEQENKDEPQTNEATELLMELACRGQYIFPTTEQQDKWWNEGIGHKKSGDFMIRIFEALGVDQEDNNGRG